MAAKAKQVQTSNDGRPFKVWFECLNCHAHVGLDDLYCRLCGLQFMLVDVASGS
jgi:hypothetical protein